MFYLSFFYLCVFHDSLLSHILLCLSFRFCFLKYYLRGLPRLILWFSRTENSSILPTFVFSLIEASFISQISPVHMPTKLTLINHLDKPARLSSPQRISCVYYLLIVTSYIRVLPALLLALISWPPLHISLRTIFYYLNVSLYIYPYIYIHTVLVWSRFFTKVSDFTICTIWGHVASAHVPVQVGWVMYEFSDMITLVKLLLHKLSGER